MAKCVAASALGLLIAGCAITPSRIPAELVVKTDLQRQELKGPVEAVAITFVEKTENGEPDERALGSARYDQAGTLVEDEQFTADFVKKRTPERRDANTTIFHSVMGDSTEHDIFDKQGNLVEEQVRYGVKFDGPADTLTRYKYDSSGAEIERDFIGPDGKLSGVSTYKRDSSGNIAKEDAWLNDPEKPHAHMLYRYDFDAHGNWVRRYETRSGVPDDDYQFGPIGTLVRTITYFGEQPAAAPRQ